MDSVDNAEIFQKQSSTLVPSQNVQNRSKKENSFVSHPSVTQSSRDLQIPQISQSAGEKMQKSFHKEKVGEILATGSDVSKNPGDQPCNAVSCSPRKSNPGSLNHNEESHQSVLSSNQQEVESKLAHLSINTPKVNTSNIKDTTGKHYVVDSCREESIINLEDVTHISECLKNLNTNDGGRYPAVKIPEAEFKIPQALSPLVMVEKYEGRLQTQRARSKLQMMHNWTPLLLPWAKPRFRLQGLLKRFSGRTCILHITKPVRKVLKNDIVSTTDGQRYQLIGPAVESSDIPENILSQFANGIPKNWGHVLQQWIREGEVPVPRRKSQEAVTDWSRERVKTGSQGPIYECNSSVSVLSDSTSTSLVSYQGRKRKCSKRLPPTRQGIDSENRGPTNIPIFCTRGNEGKVGVKGHEEDKGVPNESQNTFPVTRSMGAARDEISKKLLDISASKEHTKQKLTLNKTRSISETSTQENRKGIVSKEKEGPSRNVERRKKSGKILQRQLEGDNSEQEKCKSKTNSMSEKMEQVVENSRGENLSGEGKQESRADSSDQRIKRNVSRTDREVGVKKSERRNRSRTHSESKSKEGEKQSDKAHKSLKNSNVVQHTERAVENSEIMNSSRRKVSGKSMDTDVGKSSGYENMEPIDNSSKIRCRSRSRSQQKMKLDEEPSENSNTTKKIKQGYEKSIRNRSNSNSSLAKQGQISEQEHSKSLDSDDIELSQENVEGTERNESRSQYEQKCCRKRHESRKSLVLKAKNQHYEKILSSRSHSQKTFVAQNKNFEHGESSVRKDDDHCEKLQERLRSRSRSINKLSESGELLGKRDKSTKSSICKEKNVSTQEKDIQNHKVQNHTTHYKEGGAQIRLDSSQENLKQKQKCSSREKPAKTAKSRHLNAEEFEDEKTSDEKRQRTVLSTPDASQKNKPTKKALFELPFEVKPLRTMKQRQLANDKLLKMQKAVAVNTDYFGDPECPYNIGEDSNGKILSYTDILNEAKRDRCDKSNASSCSAITPPAKYYEKILHHAVPLTPCRSPPIEPPIYNRKDVLSRIQQQVQAPMKTYQMEVKTYQQPCEDNMQLRMDMEKKKRKEYIIPGYDIKVSYTNENVSDDDDDEYDDRSSSFNESHYSGP
ncbi:uncharacterized protein [Anabrus simplex]|uniref:uncharacterized protein isoform X2 n=1 Tax=Anabrus simplex TaxID=316456 RepID=UPI0035A33904